MKKTILLLLILNLSVFAQNIDMVQKFIKEGIALHDKGDFEGAIASYDKAIALDENSILAIGEKALSYLSLKDYENAIKLCQEAIEINPQSDNLAFIYTLYANALDEAEKPLEALAVYEEGLAVFPNRYLLHFNKGIALLRLEKYEEALLSLEEAISINPNHPGSHSAIGGILLGGNNIPALLALSRFLVLEPEGKRAEVNCNYIQDIVSADDNVEKTGNNSITISVDQMLMEAIGQKEKQANDFSMPTFLLTMTAALDHDKKTKRKNKNKNQAELFQNKFETVCSSLKEGQEDNFGFYWEYYVPYFLEMESKDLLETFSYIVYASSADKRVHTWLEKNGAKIEAFYDWSADYEWKK